MHPFFNATLTVVITTTLTLILSEGALRLIDYPHPPPIGWQWAHSPYRNQPDTNTNQMGLRGQPIEYGPDDFVIVLLGDSQVEAGTRPQDQMPGRILERVLREEHGIANVRVISIASAGWGTDQELVNLKNYFKQYRADLVLLWFTAVNDFWENTYIDRSVQVKAGYLKPTFTLDPAGKVQAYAIVPPTKIQLLLDIARAHLKKIEYPDWLLRRWLAHIPPSSAAQPGPDPVCPSTVVDQPHMFDYEGEAPITVTTDEDLERNRSHFSPFGKKRSERERYQIQITQKLLSLVAAEVESHRAQFRFFYPVRLDLDGVLSKVHCARSSLTGATLAIDGTDLVQPLDTPQLRPYRMVFSLPASRDLAIGNGDVHHNDKGNLLAMQGLANKLHEQGLIKR